MVLHSSKKFDQALNMLQKAGNTHNNLLHIQQQSFERSFIFAFACSDALESNNPLARYQKANVYVSQENYDVIIHDH